MSIAEGVNYIGFQRSNWNLHGFFEGFGNILNSILLFLFTILLVAFPLYYHVKISKNFHLFKTKPEVVRELENFLV
jgi:hypothetical protein